jgi:hypothetical protein
LPLTFSCSDSRSDPCPSIRPAHFLFYPQYNGTHIDSFTSRYIYILFLLFFPLLSFFIITNL